MTGLHPDGAMVQEAEAGVFTRESPSLETALSATPDVLCIGSVLWDIIGRTPARLDPGADVPGRIVRLPGGVALNIAMTLARLGLSPALLSAVGRDGDGDDLIRAAGGMGIDCGHIHRSDLPTDRYMAIEGAGGLVSAIADAHSLEAAGDRILQPLADGRLGSESAPWAGMIALDGNLTTALLGEIATSGLFRAADLRIATAGPGKADRLLPLLPLPNATLYLNLAEAGLLLGRPFASAPEAAAALVDRGARRVLVTDGPRPCAEAGPNGTLAAAPAQVRVARITGAGDTFMAAHIVAERRGASPAEALAAALAAAAHYISGETGS